MDYDVIIAGGGPGGSWLARELAKNNIKTLLLERSSIPGEPNFSTAGSLIYTVEKFQLPKESVAKEWDMLLVGDDKDSAIFKYDKPVGVIFDFRKLKILLQEEAKQNGAEVVLGSEVVRIESKDGYSLVTTQDGKAYRTKIAVDATGPAEVFRRTIHERPKLRPSVGLELICEAPNAPDDFRRTMAFYFGPVLAPHGYGWIFPMEGNSLKIG